MSAWEKARGLAKRHEQTGRLFVRLLDDGDRIEGVFCGEPLAREVLWTGERQEAYDSSNPAHRLGGRQPSLRVAMNFYVLPEGTMKVIEGGSRWFKDLTRMRDLHGLDRWSFEVQRQGAAGDPRTRHRIAPVTQLDDTMRERIAGTPLHDLEALTGGKREPAAASPGAKQEAVQDAEVRVDLETARQIFTRLKALPRRDAEGFFAEMNLVRVRELRAADVPRALALLWQIEREAAGVEDENDPFA